MHRALRNLRNFIRKHWIIVLLAIFGIFYYTRNIEGAKSKGKSLKWYKDAWNKCKKAKADAAKRASSANRAANAKNAASAAGWNKCKSAKANAANAASKAAKAAKAKANAAAARAAAAAARAAAAAAAAKRQRQKELRAEKAWRDARGVPAMRVRFGTSNWLHSGCKNCKAAGDALSKSGGCAETNHRCCELKLDECRHSYRLALGRCRN